MSARAKAGALLRIFGSARFDATVEVERACLVARGNNRCYGVWQLMSLNTLHCSQPGRRWQADMAIVGLPVYGFPQAHRSRGVR